MMQIETAVEKVRTGKKAGYFHKSEDVETFFIDSLASPAVIESYKNMTDERLVKLFLDNEDEEAFDEIVKRYGDKIFGLALRITRNHSDAEEVFQEVFITLINKLDSFREESKFATWLYRVATNAAFMYLRSEKRKQENETGLMDYTSYDDSGKLKGVQMKDWSNKPDDAIFSREGMEKIEKAASELPEHYRIVFQLRDVEELSNEEVAEILGLTVPAVKSRIHRARLFLRDKLSDYFYEWAE